MIFQKLSSDYDNLHFKLVGDNVAKVSNLVICKIPKIYDLMNLLSNVTFNA